MKKILCNLVVIIFVAATVLASCKSSTKEDNASQDKVEQAKDNLEEAKDSLVAAKKAATAQEWQAFKDETEFIIAANETRIAELKLKMKKTGKSMDAEYEKNIDTLEQKNKKLKSKVETYKNDANADWQSFKREFKHDIDEIGEAFKDLTIDNKK